MSETCAQLRSLRAKLVEQVKELDQKQKDALLIAQWMNINDEENLVTEGPEINKLDGSKQHIPNPKKKEEDSSRNSSRSTEHVSESKPEFGVAETNKGNGNESNHDSDSESEADSDKRWEIMKKRVKQICDKKDGDKDVPGRDVEKLIASVGDTCMQEKWRRISFTLDATYDEDSTTEVDVNMSVDKERDDNTEKPSLPRKVSFNFVGDANDSGGHQNSDSDLRQSVAESTSLPKRGKCERRHYDSLKSRKDNNKRNDR